MCNEDVKKVVFAISDNVCGSRREVASICRDV